MGRNRPLVRSAAADAAGDTGAARRTGVADTDDGTGRTGRCGPGRREGGTSAPSRPRASTLVTAALAVSAALAAVVGCAPAPGPGHAPGTLSAPPRSGTPAARESPGCHRTLVAVAHPDDDLFFLNPRIRDTIRAGCPVDTVFLTAGDGGKKDPTAAREYVDRRQYGVRAAYAEMAEAANRWDRDDVPAGGVTVRSYRLADQARNTDVRLTFLDLHDGLPEGQQPNSMRRLLTGETREIEAFQGGARYTEQRLLDTVSDLARLARADRILTLDHDNASFAFGLGGGVDHADHGTGARYVRRVGYALGIPVTAYLGYTMSPLAPNLTPGQVAEKDEVARWYLANRTCHANGTCASVAPYRGTLRKDWSLWVHRQYEVVHRAPRPGELLGDIGRTTHAAGRDPARCLDPGGTPPAAGPVRLRRCAGSPAQRWDIGGDGTIRPRADRSRCLTALGPSAGLEPCATGRAEQRWTREPWPDTTWKRTAWRIAGAGNRCLYQDDRQFPAHWADRDRQDPGLTLADCGGPPRPELYWRWGG
ncbi:PIG-L family deacetylase [Streptomyces clavuligerus]|uniref:Putative lipoprotein n=3 Tax=Streptomyces clavuligerus TaxID=1901 RepID=E2Q8A0_STRCL|nr:ricin-type beta-trefoil lectin domain protein [Streptomyces clavuligerus]ANW21419.1 hypothetical protein BB341_26010 [Streptomyces clavuligerus]AXU16051.1 hypothetical protein D1794_27030 [Streptomyces clavuligerus]EFG05432.1 Putative lipoprotein [Streptomyces clavuligerus]MBY6306186.1 PIG-L family deacetylase [Streptomyces clavuligerus]QCS08829.1 hypothetical protein CRV15_26395 [Streptomyces clavuligerus]